MGEDIVIVSFDDLYIIYFKSINYFNPFYFVLLQYNYKAVAANE